MNNVREAKRPIRVPEKTAEWFLYFTPFWNEGY